MKFLIILFYFCFLSVSGCQTLSNQEFEQPYSETTIKSPVINDDAPVIELKIDKELKLNAPLRINWKIINKSDKPVYFYSSLIKHSENANILLDTRGKNIEIFFTRFHIFEATPQDFPSGEFTKIDSKNHSKDSLLEASLLVKKIITIQMKQGSNYNKSRRENGK